jgi:hypothetical protein
MMVKRSGGFTYVFAVSMRPGDTAGTFVLRDSTGNSTVEVIGESRQLTATEGTFQDDFSSHAVNTYKIANPGM